MHIEDELNWIHVEMQVIAEYSSLWRKYEIIFMTQCRINMKLFQKQLVKNTFYRTQVIVLNFKVKISKTLLMKVLSVICYW